MTAGFSLYADISFSPSADLFISLNLIVPSLFASQLLYVILNMIRLFYIIKSMKIGDNITVTKILKGTI